MSAPIRSVAVIGGGPSGLAQVKTLNAEKCHFDIDVYESRKAVGGIWNYCPTKANYKDDEEIEKAHDHEFSPMYNKLETNILHKAMEFTGVHFPQGSADFPFRTDVLAYLQRYAGTIGEHNLYLHTKVTSVTREEKWKVESVDLTSGEVKTKEYDAVVVANGHFEVPRMPEVEGLKKWQESYPDTVTHAKFFDTPKKYKDRTVLVVGGNSSGSDIAVQISSVAKKVYVSCDEKTVLTSIKNPFVELIPRVDSYDVGQMAVNVGGKIIKGIDDVIFCTGYLYSIPFLKLDICRERYIGDLYEQIFYIPDPTLVFIGLCKDVSPFPLAEAQASLTARYFSGRLKLPSKEHMTKQFQEELEAKGVAFHSLKFPLEAEYINHLYEIIEEQDLTDGFIFEKFEGEKLERKKKTPEVKLRRVIETSNSILKKRGM